MMIYDASIEVEKKRARARLEWLIEHKKRFALTVKTSRHSINQNRYLHLILRCFAVETGYTEEEVKNEIFKKQVNRDLFYEGRRKGVIQFDFYVDKWKSTADLDKQEMITAIDRFRDFASKEAGIYLPEPSDLASIQEMENYLTSRTNKTYM